MSDLKAVFERIAAVNHWGNAESVSGDGSTLEYTYNLRHELEKVVRAFNIGSMLDAPCGDFNWMQAVPFPAGFRYLGGEIVASIVESNVARWGSASRAFRVFDLTSDPFPDVDLWFCRDCLFHLPLDAITRALRNLSRSNIAYLMTTTHLNVTNFANADIEAGGYRLLDLHAAPFRLPRDVLYRIPDYVFPYPQRELCLWSRSQVETALALRG